MSADPHKQQIPPLRFAPVGMTNFVSITSDTGPRLGVTVLVATTIGCGYGGEVNVRPILVWSGGR